MAVNNDTTNNGKWCNKGTHFVDHEGFSKMARSADGLQPTCKNCRRDYRKQNEKTIKAKKRAYREANRDRINADLRERYAKCDKAAHYQRCLQWRDQNRERYLELCRDHFQRNHESALAYGRQKYAANRDSMLEYFRNKYHSNRALYLERMAQYRATHAAELKVKKRAYWLRVATPEYLAKKAAENRLYHASHPELRRVATARRRARIKSANGSFTPSQWREKLAFHGFSCYLCGAELTERSAVVEHRIPLARRGTNWIANIAPACTSCNLRKGAKTEREFFEYLNGIT